MRTDYAHDDHYQWVENATKQKLSPLGKAVANLLGYVGGGIYNAPIAHSRVDWTNPDRIAVVWNSNLTNWDRCDLSLLWVECMRRMLRVEVEAAAPGRLRLIFFQRSTGDRETPLHKRIPDCEEMIAMVDGHFGRVQNAAEQPAEAAKEGWEFTRWSGSSPDAVKNAAMEVARLVYYRQREWPRREWGDIGQLETYSIAQLAKVIYPVLRDSWPQAQPEQPEAGRDELLPCRECGDVSLMVKGSGHQGRYVECVCGQKVGPKIGDVSEVVAAWNAQQRPQVQEAVAWRCDECGCTSRERIDEQQPDGSFAPGPSFRCVECKKESHPPTNAEAVRLLNRALPWIEFANEKASEAADKKNSADLYDDVGEFLAQHGGQGDEF